jgi:transcriptional regulator with XRE-family HTH domain
VLNLIGDKIRERRLELELTQSQLSELTNIKKNTISNYENNVSSPSEENIFKLMEALKCDANYLFEWEKVQDFKLSIEEKKHIKKYRTLDNYGQEAVDKILDVEYKRCTDNNTTFGQDKIIPSLVAARSKNNDKPIHTENLPDLSKFPIDDSDL